MSNEVNLEFSFANAFGPPIGITTIPQLVIKNLNDFVDNEIDHNLELAKKLDHGYELVGQVKQEIKIPREILEPDLFAFLLNITKHFIKMGTKQDITKFEIISAYKKKSSYSMGDLYQNAHQFVPNSFTSPSKGELTLGNNMKNTQK